MNIHTPTTLMISRPMLFAALATFAVACGANDATPMSSSKTSNGDVTTTTPKVAGTTHGDTVDQAKPGMPTAKNTGMSTDSKWQTYRSYTFDKNDSHIAQADSNKAMEVAQYARTLPNAKVAVQGAHSGNVGAVREALIGAGVPATNIELAPSSTMGARDDTQVNVLLTTG